MKRSEMIELLKSLRFAGADWADDETWAENLIAHLEEVGMVPPMQPIPEHQFQAPNEWEPENE
jgi:hypothetical protein